MRLLTLFLIFSSAPAFAARGGGTISGDYALGVHLGMTGAAQPQMNELIKRANAREGGISTSELNSAYEGALSLQYRFTGTIYAVQIRPSYFYEKQDGTGTAGAFKYGLSGYTIFPIFRLYPLENEFMRFFLQLGAGYGHVDGSIEENSSATGHGAVSFSGNSFGSMLGLGAEFCYANVHCFSVEGNYRYLSYERLVAKSSDGSFNSAGGSLSQYGAGQEIELDGQDLSAKMGGLVLLMGYTYYF